MKPRVIRSLLVLGLSLNLIQRCTAEDEFSISDGISIAENLLELGDRELVFITDIDTWDQVEFIRYFADADRSISIFDPETVLKMQNEKGKDVCPIYGDTKSPNITYPTELIPMNKIFRRKQLIPFYKQAQLIFVMTTDVQSVLSCMSLTVMNYCEEKSDRGMYHVDSKIVFLVNSEKDLSLIFSDPRVLEHPSVAAFIPTSSSSSYVVYNGDVFLNNKIQTKFIWSKQKKAKSYDDIFPTFNSFKNYKFKIAALPYAHHVTATERDDNDPLKARNNTYKDYWGFEIEMLDAVAEKYNFQYEIWNSPDGIWGSIEADGHWSGLIKHAKNGVFDFVISDILQNFPRRLVIEGTVHFENDYLVTLSPKPTLVPQYFAFVSPFTYYVWITVIGTYGVMTIVLYFISGYEQTIIQKDLTDWSVLKKCAWYTYGSMIGESISNDAKSRPAKALRWAICTWLIYCFIITMAYSGELKAYLTSPSYSKPIETLKDVLEGDLPWGMVLYGELEEYMMARSKNEIVKKIWKNKRVIKYDVLPPIEYVYNRVMILIDWRNGLSPGIEVEFSTLGGDPLLHMSSNPIFMNNYSGWAFYPFNPWGKKFSEFIQLCKETGLIHKWIRRTYQRMTDNFLAAGKEKKKALHDRPAVSSLTIRDTQGIFYLFLFFLSFGILAFAVEMIKPIK